jgi:hypothetical protein
MGMRYVLVFSLCVGLLVPGLALAQYGPVVGVAADVGYMAYRRGATFDIGAKSGAGLPEALNIRQTFPLDGVYAGLTVGAALIDGYTVKLSGSWLFPGNKGSNETVNGLFGGAYSQDGVDWATAIQWWNLDAKVSRPIMGAATAIGGLRYESFLVSFTGPSAPGGYLAGLGLAGDARADLTAVLAAPYIGVGVDYGSVGFSFILSPRAFGGARYQRSGNWLAVPGFGLPADLSGDDSGGGFKSGYLIEGTGEWRGNLGIGTGTLFAKYSYVHAAGDLAFERTWAVTPSASDTFSMGFTRENFVMGGNFAVRFTTPF